MSRCWCRSQLGSWTRIQQNSEGVCNSDLRWLLCKVTSENCSHVASMHHLLNPYQFSETRVMGSRYSMTRISVSFADWWLTLSNRNVFLNHKKLGKGVYVWIISWLAFLGSGNACSSLKGKDLWLKMGLSVRRLTPEVWWWKAQTIPLRCFAGLCPDTLKSMLLFSRLTNGIICDLKLAWCMWERR